MRLDVLAVSEDASALVLSCPSPVWRHRASLLRLADLALPQVFLGGESQLMAFAAAQSGFSAKLFFAPLPEMFSEAANLDSAWRTIGQPAHPVDRIAHLRFGSVRHARLLKGAQNIAILAEAAGKPPAWVSQHPFASGQTLPAGLSLLYAYGPATARPSRIGGGEIPAISLPDRFIAADFEAPAKPGRASDGLDLVTLMDFRDELWSAGHVPPWKGSKTQDRQDTVLLPWNMAHFGSIVPLLLERLTKLDQPGGGLKRFIVLPFNDAGHPGALRALVKQVGQAAPKMGSALRQILLGRVTHLRGLTQLAKLSRLAWVDGNDPEHWWTLERLRIAGFESILIDSGLPTQTGGLRLPADETLFLESDLDYGGLSWPARLPSHRQLHKLLTMKAGKPPPMAATARRARPP